MISLLKLANNLLWNFLSLFTEECLICSFKIFFVMIFPEMIYCGSKTSLWAHYLSWPIILLQRFKVNYISVDILSKFFLLTIFGAALGLIVMLAG